MARGSTPETTANVAIAITQRFQDATDFTDYHTDYDVWATNNHTIPERSSAIGLAA